MVWNTIAPDGSVSVKANESILQANTDYIQTKMRLDHFWDEDANNDGHHQKVEMPDTAVDPVALSTGMTGQIYFRKKTVAEQNGAVQTTEPFFITPVGATLLPCQFGFRALGSFDIAGGVLTTKYSHNCTITHTSTGIFTILFVVAPPSVNYIVLSDGIRNNPSDRQHGNMSIAAGETKSAVMSTSGFRLVFTKNDDQTLENPVSGWFAVIGG